ncbi:MAG TPA: GNAT family N-acetyltransferase [Pyrinomonadaceae bacterium]|nr:GNAT family N-acetyltransferase [Pyrinomonadaceae bacterium]
MKANGQLNVDRQISDGPLLTLVPDESHVRELKNENEAELLAFLAARPVHTVAMASFVRDNGIESPLNRGEFFGYRNTAGELEGVALIGHTTLVEARTPGALEGLALRARAATTPIHLIMSSGTMANSFWNYLVGYKKSPTQEFTELLFETGFPLAVHASEHDVRLATSDELEAVAEAHAEVAVIEQGTNPMERDREGFLRRTLRRIEQGRVFVVVKGDRLVFKADVIAETDGVAYLEGIYTDPEYRGQGMAPKCLSKVFTELLKRVDNVCLLSNVEFTSAHRSFARAGMRNTDACTTLFV